MCECGVLGVAQLLRLRNLFLGEGRQKKGADKLRSAHQPHRDTKKQADRPDSVTATSVAMTVIHLGAELLRHSSFLPARSASSLNACLFGIAPGGGYRVSP